jgi:hypothetical protein
MADNNSEYVIRVVQEIVDTRTPTNQLPSTATPNPTPQAQNTPSTTPTPSASNNTKSILGSISAQFMIEAGSKLLNATGNSEMAQAIGDVSRYVFLGIRAASGDPSAIAALAINVAAKALTEVGKVQREQAQARNELDMARASAGLLDMSGVKVTKQFFTGRYQYSRT